MKVILTAATLGIACLVPIGAVADGGGARDFAVGAGSSEFAIGLVGEASFTLSATSAAEGSGPRGYVTTKGDPDGAGPMEPFTAKGHVTCLRVNGNRASIKWRFEEATGSAAPFAGIQTFVEDNGPPRRGEPTDRAALDPPQAAATFEATATQCDDPATRATYERLNRGNVTVNDAAAR
jgi:hypothetical protein